MIKPMSFSMCYTFRYAFVRVVGGTPAEITPLLLECKDEWNSKARFGQLDETSQRVMRLDHVRGEPKLIGLVDNILIRRVDGDAVDNLGKIEMILISPSDSRITIRPLTINSLPYELDFLGEDLDSLNLGNQNVKGLVEPWTDADLRPIGWLVTSFEERLRNYLECRQMDKVLREQRRLQGDRPPMNLETQWKLLKLREIRAQRIVSGRVTITWSDACSLVPIRRETALRHAPELRMQWDNPKFG